MRAAKAMPVVYRETGPVCCSGAPIRAVEGAPERPWQQGGGAFEAPPAEACAPARWPRSHADDGTARHCRW